jgi:hypothetical protein
MQRAGAGLLALLSFASIPASAARGCGPAVVQVTVLDQGGAAVNGLAPSDFKVRIKNANAAVTAMSYGIFPHSTLVLVSRTGSMSETLKMELSKRLASSVIASAPGVVFAGTFGAQLSSVTDARSGQPFAVGAQPPENLTNLLYDDVLAGLGSVTSHRGDALVVITDSSDKGSKATPAELRQRLALTGARLFIVALPPATNVGSMQPLAELAEASGGSVMVPIGVDATTKGVVITIDQLDSAVASFTRAYAQAGNVYQLETDQDASDKPVPLHVELDRKKLGRGKVLAPSALAPCSANPQ